MPVARGQWAELLAPGLNMSTYTSYRMHPEMYRVLVNVKDSRKAFEDSFRIAGLGPLAVKPELSTTILDQPIKIGGQRYVNKTYALGVAISKEMRDDSQYAEILALAEMLGVSSYWTAELYGHDVFNNGFNALKYIGRDGLPLFHIAHPIQGTGLTMGNRPNPDADLAEASLEAAILAFDLQQNERGMPILLQPRNLFVHPSNRMLAKRLLNSAGFPFTNFNDVNPLMDEGLTARSDPWFTDSVAWFLTSEPNQTDVRFYWREMPDSKTWDDDNADATFHKMRQRHSTGFGDWRGVYGSATA
jgi:hypothetical protein